MKISAINNNFISKSNTNFRGKHYDNTRGTNPTVTSTVKAVPLAVLLAMSPLNAIDTKAQVMDPAKVYNEQMFKKEGKVISTNTYDNVNSFYDECKVDLISTDGNDATIEDALLTFSKKQIGKTKSGEIKVKEYNFILTPMDLGVWSDEAGKHYAVQGPGIEGGVIYSPELTAVPSNSGKVLNSSETLALEITKEFYDVLSKALIK